MELLIDVFRALKSLIRPRPASPAPPAGGQPGGRAYDAAEDADPLLRHKRAIENSDPATVARALKRLIRKGQ
jgi:hypothetical protein